MSITIRAARRGDGAILHAMSRELAVHHGHGDDFTSVPEDFDRLLGDPRWISGALIAEWNGEPAGCAIWHRAFSTFRGRETVYLEDLSVLPAFRGKGIGQTLLKAMARLTRQRGAAALHWLMLDWNHDARRFYQAAGAKIEDGNCLCLLAGDALERLST